MSAHDEARNAGPRVGAGPFWGYIGTVTLAGLLLVALQAREVTTSSVDMMGGALVAVAVLIVIGEVRPLVIAGSRDASGVTTSTAFVFALLLHIGLPTALCMQAIATVIAEMLARKAPWRTAFNVAQFSLSYAAASVVMGWCGRHPSPTNMLNVSGRDLPTIACGATAYFIVNIALVAAALALRNHTRFRDEVEVDFAFQLTSTGALLGIAPIIVIVINRGPALIPLMLFPLAAVYATASLTREREQHSLHDSLTGLPNRILLDQLTCSALREAADLNKHLALFLLDLDRFKEINDTLGHQVGDTLLQGVGSRITAAIGTDNVVARLGGDEFAVLLPELDEPADAFDMAQRLRDALAVPYRHDDFAYEVEASIGVALSPEHGLDFDTLYQRADIAMYVAKENGTGVQTYSTEIDRHSTARLSMVAELRRALEQGEFTLNYQPKADLRTGDVVGVEALLRWQHPERGRVAPDEFIPLAEQTGLMRHITRFVLDEALRQLADWWEHGLQVQVAVNVSARDLYDRGFADSLRESIDRYHVPPRALMVEVTESILMADPARAAATLLSLASLGVGVSLDDFGTGYSSLVHLKRLPVSEVKIDKSFVMRMDVSEDDAAIVRSIIDLAGALGLRTVAEGVETKQSWDRLAVFGCDAAQGWYLSKPMPAPEVTAWMQNARTDRANGGSQPAAVPASGAMSSAESLTA